MSDILARLRDLADKAADLDPSAKDPLSAWTPADIAFTMFHLSDVMNLIEAIVDERHVAWVKAEEGSPEYQAEIEKVTAAYVRTEEALMNLGVEREEE